MIKYLCLLIAIISIQVSSYAETTFLPMKLNNSSIWYADSFFVGAGIKAVKKTNVLIKKVFSNTAFKGKLFYVNNTNDSLQLLFENKDTINDVNLGVVDSGTDLIFAYMPVAVDKEYDRILFKKLYTGQNRVNVDRYISEIRNGIFGYRWSVVGQVDSSTVQIGFDTNGSLLFQDIMFTVTNAKVQR